MNEPIERPYDEKREHPSLEQIMLNMAVDHLTKPQRHLWELWNYDRLTQEEIASILNIAQKNVHSRIKTIERKIVKWCQTNRAAYMLLKLEHKIMNEDNE